VKLAAAIVLVAATASAHPGVGIVCDSRGNIFYTDLKQVWRIAPDGQKSVVVPNVHTHELYLDANDNLYGEHLWYNGEKLNTWGLRVWRRSPDGKVVDVVPSHDAFSEPFFSFVRDAAGSQYFSKENRVWIRSGKELRDLAHQTFRDIRWMTATPDGVLYFIDTLDLIRVANGATTTVAKNLSELHVPRAWIGSRHRLMGLWTDRSGNVYVADAAGAKVKRIDAKGKVTIVASSSYPWSPSGGTFDRQGNLWLLEFNPINDVRVRKVPLTRPSATLSPLRGARGYAYSFSPLAGRRCPKGG